MKYTITQENSQSESRLLPFIDNVITSSMCCEGSWSLTTPFQKVLSSVNLCLREEDNLIVVMWTEDKHMATLVEFTKRQHTSQAALISVGTLTDAVWEIPFNKPKKIHFWCFSLRYVSTDCSRSEMHWYSISVKHRNWQLFQLSTVEKMTLTESRHRCLSDVSHYFALAHLWQQ